MPYELLQWPSSVQTGEIDSLPLDAANAIMVLLRLMRTDGPKPKGYKIKPLPGKWHGLDQVNMKINKEQIRMLFSVYARKIVVFSAFKKTSPQIEKRMYQRALDRKKTAEIMLRSGDALPTIN